MSNKVYLGIIAALACLVGYLAYQVNNKQREIVYISAEYQNLDDDRKQLAVELEAMKQEYDTLTVTNAEMQGKIDAQQAEIQGLLSKVKNQNYDIRKLKAEAETLRGIMKHYIYQIDSLNRLNQQLIVERDEQSTRADQAEAKGKELESELSTSKEMNAKGAVLSAGEFTNTGQFERNSGATKETDRASKCEIIKSCFSIRRNAIAKPGKRNIYLKIEGPDGRTLSRDGGEFSASREIDYSQNDTPVCITYQAAAGYEYAKGNYKISVIENGNVIGSSTMVLR